VKRSALALVAALVAAFAVMGAAATLGVSTKKVDSFTKDQVATTQAGDATAPTLTKLEMFDTGTTPNGKIDQVVATFNEPLQATSSSDGWSLTSTPSAGTLGGVTVVASSTTATVSITEGSGAADTAVGSFKLALDQTTSAIKDLSGNKASFAATAPIDLAKPIPTDLLISNVGGTAGRADVGDLVTVTWSEELNPTSICSVFADQPGAQVRSGNLNSGHEVLITNSSAAGGDILTAGTFDCALQFGSITLGSTSFVSSDTAFGSNANSGSARASATWDSAARTLQLRLGTGTGTAVGSTTATFSADTDLVDAAGNKATGTRSRTAVHF
jgi:hypothetical protein